MSTEILKAEYGAADRPLKIGEIEIPCYVLEDGKRVIVQRGLFKALGIQQGGSSEKYKEYGGAARLASFLDQNGLISFNSNGLRVLQEPIIFSVNNTTHYGYEATILQEIVRAISKAFLKGQLPQRQQDIGINAEILDDAFAKVGITALVDEATGYQYKREKDELQKILKSYIAQELLPWQKKFPDIFYKELFRLNGWDYTVGGIKRRPGVIGTWTNKLIYEQLPPGVLHELKNKTPKSGAGNYTARFFQSLTADTGDPHLTAQIQQIITLFQLSDNMEHVWEQFAKLKARQSGQLELPFKFDEKGHTKDPEPPLSDFNEKLKKALDYNPKDDKSSK